MKKDTWKPIPEWEHYQASTNGRIKNKKGVIMKQCITGTSKYPMVSLRYKGYRKNITVHRLVAITFLDNPHNKPCVNHKDRNKKNNTVNNLEWVTKKENSRHAFDNGVKSGSRKPLALQEILTGKIIKFDSISEAGRFLGYSKTCACAVITEAMQFNYKLRGKYRGIRL